MSGKWIGDKWIVPEGDVAKVDGTLRYFTELRASLKNGLDVERDLRNEVEMLRRALSEHHAHGVLDGVLPGDECPVCVRWLTNVPVVREALDKVVLDEDDPRPCTCTLACIPAGIAANQFCRQREAP